MLKKAHNIAICLMVTFTFFIFAPLEVYFSNIDDIWFGIGDFILYLAIGFIAFFSAGMLLDVCGCKYFSKIWNYIVYTIFLITLALYIQGNFLKNDYGQLDGQPIDWSMYRDKGIISVSVFVAVFLIGIVLLYVLKQNKALKMARTIGWCMLILQVYTLVMACVINNGFKDKGGYIVTSENETEYSSKNNLIVLIVDAFDSRVMNDLLESDFCDEIDDAFEGFTFYKNTTGVYTLTDFAVPQIITGEYYLNETTYGEYLNQAYDKSLLMQELLEREYKVNIYTNISIPQGEIAKKVANWKYEELRVSSHRKLLDYMYKLVGFRYLPQPLKEYCWFYSDDMDSLKISDESEPYEWANVHFNDNISGISTNDEGDSCHIFHIKGLHVIRNYNEWFEEADDVSLEETGRGIVRMLERYFEKLKELGIYDNSVILVMADHGAIEYDVQGGKQSPLLMIKPIDSCGRLEVDDTAISYEELQTTFIELLDGKNDISFEGNKERYIYMTTWKGEALSAEDTSNEFVKYKIQGHAYETEKVVKCEP